jgi:hypothetical protein
VRKLLESRAKFGADPQLVSRLNAVSRKLKALPKQFEAVTEAKPPNFPKYEAPKTSEIEPFKAKGKEPEAPELQKFSPEDFRREKILSKAEKLSDLTGWDILAGAEGMREVFTGHPPYAWGYPVGKRVASRVLQNPSVLDWLSGENPQSTTFPGAGRSGPKGGINARGYETSMRPTSTGDLVQALHTESDELLRRLKSTPIDHPEFENLNKRLKENFELILQLEGGGRGSVH